MEQETVEGRPPHGHKLAARVAINLIEAGMELACHSGDAALIEMWERLRNEYLPLLEKAAR